MGFELFVPLGISASPSWWSRARSPPGVPERYRRILPVPGRAREGLLTEPRADALSGDPRLRSPHRLQPGDHVQNHSGRADFELGHIPGAQFVDVLSELSDMGHPVPLMAPTASSAAAISFTCKWMTYARGGRVRDRGTVSEQKTAEPSSSKSQSRPAPRLKTSEGLNTGLAHG